MGIISLTSILIFYYKNKQLIRQQQKNLQNQKDLQKRGGPGGFENRMSVDPRLDRARTDPRRDHSGIGHINRNIDPRLNPADPRLSRGVDNSELKIRDER